MIACSFVLLLGLMQLTASPSGRLSAEIVGSKPAGKHGYLSLVSFVCCHVEVSATS